MKNNEPVAWMDKETGQVSRVACYDIPLYTAPKELSDEEIISCMGMEMKTLKEESLDFARALLKKASEK